jgi:dienelactone hydrolase
MTEIDKLKGLEDANRAVKRFRFFLALATIVLLSGLVTAYGFVLYRRFYHHVTPQELSHEVRHSVFNATIRDGSPLTLQLYQQANSSNQPLVLFSSGDGGWSPFCADIAAHIAATGQTVVGFNVKDYLVNFASSQKPVSADELGRDYQSIIQASASQAGVASTSRVTLAGWSLGAGYSVLVASDPTLRDKIERVVAISLPVYNELAWKPTDALIYITHGTPREKVFDAHEFLSRVNSTPLVLLNATDDDTSPLREAQSLFKVASEPKHLFTIKASGHHFEGGESEFYQDLDASLPHNDTH